jgi:hypothetical protein
MPKITVREYNPESGALVSNVSTLNFGRITAGTHSRVKVVDLAFTEVTEVGNIKIGLISSGGLIINVNPSDIGADGSSSSGRFGVESSSTFDATKGSSPLSRHFAGINSDVTAGSTSNVSVGNRTSTLSDYIYLDIEIGASDLDEGNGAYKVFFDYS